MGRFRDGLLGCLCTLCDDLFAYLGAASSVIATLPRFHSLTDGFVLRGAVLVVSHDDGFLRRIVPDLVLELREGALTEIG